MYIFFPSSCENVLDLFDFLLLLWESEDAALEEEDVEDNLRLLLFLVFDCVGV